jgi:hypothetical protein
MDLDLEKYYTIDIKKATNKLNNQYFQIPDDIDSFSVSKSGNLKFLSKNSTLSNGYKLEGSISDSQIYLEETKMIYLLKYKQMLIGNLKNNELLIYNSSNSSQTNHNGCKYIIAGESYKLCINKEYQITINLQSHGQSKLIGLINLYNNIYFVKGKLKHKRVILKLYNYNKDMKKTFVCDAWLQRELILKHDIGYIINKKEERFFNLIIYWQLRNKIRSTYDLEKYKWERNLLSRPEYVFVYLCRFKMVVFNTIISYLG